MKRILTCNVKDEWVDYNGHMNDSEYAKVFSLSVDEWMRQIGITPDFRDSKQYTIFTLETHLCYLNEANVDEVLTIKLQLLDYDVKRAHVFFVMINAEGNRVATSEQMLMGMDMHKGKPAPFPEEILNKIKDIAQDQKGLKLPKEAGQTIGIRHK